MAIATVTRPSSSLPNPGDNIDAEPIRDYITNILAFLESASLKSGNVVTDTTANTDAILTQDTVQTVNGKKSFTSTASAGTTNPTEVTEIGVDPASGTVAIGDGTRVTLFADNGAGTKTDIAYIDAVFSDVTGGAEVSYLEFSVSDGSGSAVSQIQIQNGAIVPTTTDDVSLGTTALNFSDLFLDSGAVINFDSGDITITHSANTLTLAGGTAVGFGTSIANDANNRVTTADGSGGLNGEANLTFDGTTLRAQSEIVQGMPSTQYTSTDQNAQRIIFVDLDDPLTLWDYEAFMQQIQGTSWHDELGDPPVHGLMFITEAQDKVVWWNRETGAAYMTFDTASGNMLPSGNATLTGIAFKDGKLHVIENSGSFIMAYIDFLTDKCWSVYTNASYLRSNNISERNSGSGTSIGSFGTGNPFGGYLVNSFPNDVALCRDPDEVDEFGRPLHWVAWATDGGGSVYNPVTDAIYDSAITVDFDHLALSDDGNLVIFDDNGSRGLVEPMGSIFGISADGWSSTATDRWFNGNADATDLAWTDGESQTQQKPVILERASWASEGGRQVWIASQTAGIYVAHTHPSDLPGKGGLIRLHEDYASPYMKGDVRGCWPLHSTADVSPSGYTLTNNNTVTFASGGPAGSYAEFDGANTFLNDIGESGYNAGTTDFSVACWFRSSSASNPGSTEFIWYLDDGTPTDYITLYITTSGYPYFQISDDGGSSSDSVNPSVDIYDGNWHYLVAQRNSGTWEVWVDGVLIGSTAVSAAAAALSVDDLHIGSNDSGASVLDGDIGGFVYSGTAMTEREIKAEYARGLRRLSTTATGIDANTTISDNDIAAVAADPHGRYVAVLSDDKAVRIFDEFAVPVASDTYQGTTARDLAIRSMPNGTDPHYVIGGSDEFEVVQPDTRL